MPSFETTIRLQPQHAGAQNNLTLALLKKGEVQGAIDHGRKALQIQPDNPELHNNLAVALLRDGQIAAAVAEWRETVRLHPDKISVTITLAWILSTAPEPSIRDGTRALDLALRAYQTSGGRNLMISRVLAAAYAENGRFPEAIQVVQEAEQRAEASGQSASASLLQGDLDLYQQGVPLRDPTHGGRNIVALIGRTFPFVIPALFSKLQPNEKHDRIWPRRERDAAARKSASRSIRSIAGRATS